MKENRDNLNEYLPVKKSWQRHARFGGNCNTNLAISYLEGLPALTGTGPSVRIILDLKTFIIIATKGDFKSVFGVNYTKNLSIDFHIPFILSEHNNFIGNNFSKYLAYLTNCPPENREKVEFSICFKYWLKTKYHWINQRVFKVFNNEYGVITHVLMEYTDISEVKKDEKAQFIVYDRTKGMYIINKFIEGSPGCINNLTATELQIASMIKDGFSVEEIASKRFISPQTVKQHKKNIYKKLNINKSTQLVKWACENGLNL